MSTKEIFDTYNVFSVETDEKQIIIKKINGMLMKITEWKSTGKQELNYPTKKQVMRFLDEHKGYLQVG